MKSLPTPIYVLLLLLIPALLNGCGEAPSDHSQLVRKGAPPEIVAVGGKAKLIPAGFVKRRLRLGYPSLKSFLISDLQYMYITEHWFREVLEWSDYFIRQQVPELDNLKELPTAYEETFSELMSNVANLSVAKRYNVKASVLIGLMVANSDKPWGRIPADGKPRRYIVGLTEHGGIIYDIPTRQISSLEKFPNQDSMTGVMF
ncbi:MAG: hypothetical protein ABFS19_12375 [Thermodesulfobacteriota bacterium]